MDNKPSCTGGRRRHTKKSKKHSRRRHTRRGGAAFASAGQPVLGQGGQPAGLEFSAVGVSGQTPYAASSYNGAPSTANGYSGGRRRSRRGRKSRKSRHRMRGGGGTGAGGDAGSRIATEFRGPVSGVNWGVAERGAVYTGSPGTA